MSLYFWFTPDIFLPIFGITPDGSYFPSFFKFLIHSLYFPVGRFHFLYWEQEFSAENKFVDVVTNKTTIVNKIFFIFFFSS